jgi:hypothetical protein
LVCCTKKNLATLQVMRKKDKYILRRGIEKVFNVWRKKRLLPHLKTRDILWTSLSRGDFLPPQLPSEEALPFRCW